MPNTGIEPATFQSLARRSNQLSYAAAKLRVTKSSSRNAQVVFPSTWMYPCDPTPIV